jgi:hypothetical protein
MVISPNFLQKPQRFVVEEGNHEPGVTFYILPAGKETGLGPIPARCDAEQGVAALLETDAVGDTSYEVDYMELRRRSFCDGERGHVVSFAVR